MTPPSDRSARAFAALAAALGITIGVAPGSLFAQGTVRPSAVEREKSAVQNKGATIEATQSKTRNAAAQLKGESLKGQQIKGQQTKGEQLKGEQLKGQQIKGQQIKGQQLKGQQLKGEQLKAPQTGSPQTKGPGR